MFDDLLEERLRSILREAGGELSLSVTAAELEPILLAGIEPGDVVMIKGSFGSRMAPLVEALQRHFKATGSSA